MSESVVVEIYENETLSGGHWVEDSIKHWSSKDNMPARAPEELVLPSSEWSWASNWRIDKIPGHTDVEGWEYA
jgi:hypothetical protein